MIIWFTAVWGDGSGAQGEYSEALAVLLIGVDCDPGSTVCSWQ